jgi:hypothetical protein
MDSSRFCGREFAATTDAHQLNKEETDMDATTIGVDLAKNVFAVSSSASRCEISSDRCEPTTRTEPFISNSVRTGRSDSRRVNRLHRLARLLLSRRPVSLVRGRLPLTQNLTSGSSHWARATRSTPRRANSKSSSRPPRTRASERRFRLTDAGSRIAPTNRAGTLVPGDHRAVDCCWTAGSVVGASAESAASQTTFQTREQGRRHNPLERLLVEFL